ncbi:MAG: sigma-70 family RNA polymerase sigma factor [Chryseolinea sp.]
MSTEDLIPHLFRTEYRKIVSVLCRRFGFDEIEIAEDIASETFLTASQAWGIEGIPPNPVGWLYTVAKNKAANQLQRRKLFENKISSDFAYSLIAPANEIDIDLSPQHIEDSQLQMMFSLCHPELNAETQVGLCLRILCGFGIEEIADAFLTGKETINKRLLRGKERLRAAKIEIRMPEQVEIEARLESVLTTIYLLFNEGYYSISKNQTLRKDLCLEAIRLCTMLVENAQTDRPEVNGLLSLMCFHISRFDARLDGSGEIVLYNEQETSSWNNDWISKGGYFLIRAGRGQKLYSYHIEAAIAYWSTRKEDTMEKWKQVLKLYDELLLIKYSPAAALNRVYALSKVEGTASAIKEALKLEFTENHFYYSLLGEFYLNVDREKAKEYFRLALSIAKSSSDKLSIRKRLASL